MQEILPGNVVSICSMWKLTQGTKKHLVLVITVLMTWF